MSTYLATSSRLGLQALSLEKHLQDYHEHMSHEIAFKYLHRQPPQSVEESRKHMIERHLSSAKHPHKEMYAIVLLPGGKDGLEKSTNEKEGEGKDGEVKKKDERDIEEGKGEGERETEGKMLGTVGIPRIGDGTVEIGYGIHKDYWGRGIASEAVKLFVAYYWGERGGQTQNTIIAYTHPENTASARVLEKSGFRNEGRVQNAYEAYDEAIKQVRWFPALKWSLERGNAGRL